MANKSKRPPKPQFELVSKVDIRFRFNYPAKNKLQIAHRAKMNQELKSICDQIRPKIIEAVIREYNLRSPVKINITTTVKKEPVCETSKP